MQYQTTVWQ